MTAAEGPTLSVPRAPDRSEEEPASADRADPSAAPTDGAVVDVRWWSGDGHLPTPPLPPAPALPPPPPPRPVDPAARAHGVGWQEIAEGAEPSPEPLAAPPPRRVPWRLVTGAVVVAVVAAGWLSAGGV